MHRPGLRGLGGAAAAVVAFVAAVAFSTEVGEAPGAEAPAGSASYAYPAPPREPGPAGLVDVIDAQLEARMPRVASFGRRLIARTIVAEAELARIDALLVLALIQVESRFDPAALSGRGARGLMQLREPTLRRELERHGIALEDPHDPVTNVRAGVRYLRRLLDAFGREEIALMAYNAGPNRILGYLREGEIPERFHAYPRRVKTELRKLRRRVGATPPAALAESAVVPVPQ